MHGTAERLYLKETQVYLGAYGSVGGKDGKQGEEELEEAVRSWECPGHLGSGKPTEAAAEALTAGFFVECGRLI